MKRFVSIIGAMLATTAVAQDEPAGTESEPAAVTAEATSDSGGTGVKTLSGMSILGNEEAPKSLVIVPWKSSRLGDGLGISDSLDDSPRAVDKEVFLRELHFYELRATGAE